MTRYYQDRRYHETYIRCINSNWRIGMHDAQLEMCRRIPAGSRILEVGCGDGNGAAEILKRVVGGRYIGVDFNAALWADKPGIDFAQASAAQLPFSSASFDVVLSMYVIEHLVFPADYLEEAWRVLRPGGRLFTVAPDFLYHAMPSERIGFSYGSGRDKWRRGRVLDAVWTALDGRVRTAFRRFWRRRALARGDCSFPILVNPRCFDLSGFTPDCDAVYPSAPEEVLNYFQARDRAAAVIFSRSRSTFGLEIIKASHAS